MTLIIQNLYMAQSTRKGHFGWQSIYFLTNFESFVLLTYQLGIEFSKKKNHVQKHLDPWGNIELPLSGLFQVWGNISFYEIKIEKLVLEAWW